MYLYLYQITGTQFVRQTARKGWVIFRVLFGNVLGLAKEKVHMWLFVVSLWPLAFYFGHRVYNRLANAFGLLYVL
ncbi:hypothetical protein DMN91_003474 [Ooceraea biroi]|uniref:Uncharacterized protein n=1 Tax=Ooceraea biroi TaxID=2015173 RepID=A0A3L8DS87_OOCBI|nr:hypothetical protein DMN91_003474 [Ooceraea biroi]